MQRRLRPTIYYNPTIAVMQVITTRALRGIISGGITARDYSEATGTDAHDAQSILDYLEQAGIGRVTGETYSFERGDRLRAAIALLERGAALDEIALEIDWRDFEGLTTEILASKNFVVMKNLRFKRPSIEIDVVGIRMGVAMLVDCKHWKRTARSAISDAVAKQIERTRRYVAETPGAVAVPVIVTLHRHEVEFVNNVPIVHISGFSSFVDEFYGHLDKMRVIDDGTGSDPSAACPATTTTETGS